MNKNSYYGLQLRAIGLQFIQGLIGRGVLGMSMILRPMPQKRCVSLETLSAFNVRETYRHSATGSCSITSPLTALSKRGIGAGDLCPG